MTPINRPDRAVDFGLLSQFLRQLRLYVRGFVDLHSNLFRRQKVPAHTELTSQVAVSHALDNVRREARKIPRQGWRQFYLPPETETVNDHVQDTSSDFLSVAHEAGLSQEETIRGVNMIDIHELDEVIDGRDEPLIPTNKMPRSRADREKFQSEIWVPPSREEELLRIRKKFEDNREKFEEWMVKHVPMDQRSIWLGLLREFHYVDTPVAELCFEVHALQSARKAVFLAMDEEVRFTWKAAEPFVRRAERLITNPHVKARLEVLRTTLAENDPDSVAVS